MPDCIYLCNSPTGKSAVAYYKVALPAPGDNDPSQFPQGGNVGQQPDDLVYTSDLNHVWEGSEQTFTFTKSGVTLTINLPESAKSSAGSFPNGVPIFGVTANNGTENFDVSKMDQRLLVIDGDGVALTMTYFLIADLLP